MHHLSRIRYSKLSFETNRLRINWLYVCAFPHRFWQAGSFHFTPSWIFKGSSLPIASLQAHRGIDLNLKRRYTSNRTLCIDLTMCNVGQHGQLSCISFAGDKSYPRRRNVYAYEDPVRNDIQLLSYYIAKFRQERPAVSIKELPSGIWLCFRSCADKMNNRRSQFNGVLLDLKWSILELLYHRKLNSMRIFYKRAKIKLNHF